MKRLSIPVAAVLAAAACGGSEEPGRLPAPSEPVTVTVSEAVATASSEAFPATLMARREAQVATRMSGTVREVRVDVGDRVGAGQVLVVLDAGDVHARIDAAAGAAELARRTFQRVRNLAADGAASQQELDEARARLDAAEGGLADARAQAGYATVTAPFTGVVVARSADPGDLAVPGRPLLRLVDHGALKVQADLPGGRAGTVGVGDPVRVTLPGGETHTARVTRVAPAVTGGVAASGWKRPSSRPCSRAGRSSPAPGPASRCPTRAPARGGSRPTRWCGGASSPARTWWRTASSASAGSGWASSGATPSRCWRGRRPPDP